MNNRRLFSTFKLHILILFLLCVCAFSVKAQQDNAVLARIILIGDAGKIEDGQAAVIKHAASQVIVGKTVALFLGDNIYPDGMGLPGSHNEVETQQILRAQYMPLRAKKAPVFFIPGNHDWDDSGKDGLAKIKRQWSFLQAQKDSLLKLVPANGCPDPVEINVTKDLSIIAFDSAWWLYSHDKGGNRSDCACTTKEEVLSQLKSLVQKNKDKVILLATHHPFQTYGEHGGYKDIPLLGTIYRDARLLFPGKQDTPHPLYQDMIKRVNAIVSKAPHVIHVAGHDHGLQLIKSDIIQVVSGSGAKTSSVLKGKNTLFSNSKQGYVIADLLREKRVKLRFFVFSGKEVKEAFSTEINTNSPE